MLSRYAGGRVLALMWRRFLVFLEIIGLKKETSGDPAERIAQFRLYHGEFRTLLAANDSFLATLSEIERVLHGRFVVDPLFLKRRAVRAVADVHRMVRSLGAISGNRYKGLGDSFSRIAAELTAAVDRILVHHPKNLVLDLAVIRAAHTAVVGGKMANLGHLRNALALPAPDGFAVTTEGFHLIVGEQDDTPPAERIRAAEIPTALGDAILKEYDRLASRTGFEPRMAVRSSALGEDGEHSFAGQFLTILNVDRQGLIKAYRDVLASLYSAEAVAYRRLHRIPEESAAMAVGFVAMVDAEAAGMIYSRDPRRPETGGVLIHAVRGLGVTLADGGSSAESIEVARQGDPEAVSRTVSAQNAMAVAGPAGSVREEALAAEQRGRPCLTDEAARTLARWATRLEDDFGAPQDIEWVLDREGRLFLLQSRPLRMAAGGTIGNKPAAGYRLLVSGGETACPGVGAGPAVHMDQDADLGAFPDGGVLIARRSSPRFVQVLDRARAIVTDAGSVTGHMASLAREFEVPALLNTETATREIPAGVMVTVDAGAGFVYEGVVDHLLREHEAAKQTRTSTAAPDGALQAELDRVAGLLVPLHLTDPRALEFAPKHCRTLHDVARFIHEKSYEEMFTLGEHLGDARSSAYLLDVFLPIDLYIIDLGGGIEPPASGNKIKARHVRSMPLSAVLDGMLDKRLPRYGAKPIDLGGFLSVMMQHATSNPEGDRTFRDPSYAIVSDTYLNYTARVGYHFSVVDAYCSPHAARNYISFRFQGGAADVQRRVRRTRAIMGILREKGFAVSMIDDGVSARLGKGTREETRDQLVMLGRLLQFFRQMDASMVSDRASDQLKEAFLRGDFGLDDLGS